MPGKMCAVAVCRNSFYKTGHLKGENSVAYFSFPKDLSLRKKWVAVCRRKDNFNPDKSSICSIHFQRTDFERNLAMEMGFERYRKKLKPGMVPTRRLHNSRTPSPEELSARNKRQEVRERKELVKALLEKKEPEIACDEPSSRSDVLPPGSCECIISEVELRSVNISQITSSSLIIDYHNLLAQHQQLHEEYKSFRSKSHLEISKLKGEINERDNHVKKRIRDILSRIFTENQIDLLIGLRKQTWRWPVEDLAVAYAIRFMSKRCYKYLMKTLNFPLPGISTLQRRAAL